MPVDTSMYQIQQQQPVAQPDTLGSLSKAYSVAGMANQLRTQQGMRDAYAANTDQNGQLNQAGVSFRSRKGKPAGCDSDAE